MEKRCCEKCWAHPDSQLKRQCKGHCSCHEKSCDKCLAHNIGDNHECDPLISALKATYGEKHGHTEQKGWRENYTNFPLQRITRVEVIDHSLPAEDGGGRCYVKNQQGIEVTLSFQDDYRTLKVFIKKRND